MRKIFILFLALISLSVTSCIENEDIVIKKDFVEFDAATYNSFGLDKNYPVLSRHQTEGHYGRGVYTATTNGIPADPLISRTSGTIRFRVNLVGPQRSTETQIAYSVVPGETFQTKNATTGAIIIDGQPAVQGTHFTTTGTLTIPANSSFGIVEVNILNPGTALATERLIVLELQGSEAAKLPASANYKRIGILINKG
ncbi:hypothetical protein [Pontibacter cellulosilyticus]|uniref:DUF4843 domain-containing protein n=1 Tax=Pontibacter cellulosilyticus TaxID=1720253 RepID=A0A923N5Z9_9BACT|nr:hypothetical protein [Pontibacter cellulosilyticus]MBC5992856.1 hypothetical protein [Pontibacter cellulosilyticus]